MKGAVAHVDVDAVLVEQVDEEVAAVAERVAHLRDRPSVGVFGASTPARWTKLTAHETECEWSLPACPTNSSVAWR